MYTQENIIKAASKSVTVDELLENLGIVERTVSVVFKTNNLSKHMQLKSIIGDDCEIVSVSAGEHPGMRKWRYGSTTHYLQHNAKYSFCGIHLRVDGTRDDGPVNCLPCKLVLRYGYDWVELLPGTDGKDHLTDANEESRCGAELADHDVVCGVRCSKCLHLFAINI